MASRSRDAEAELNLPPGFRFYPTDEELVLHYLCRKAAHQFLPVPIIAEVDLYKYDPWQLPDMALFGQKEWYFFTPRDRKYPNGSRPNRAAGTGYWKATGADKPVIPGGSVKPLGIKKALVFYAGKSPRGVKTNWIMHEYRLADSSRTNNKKGSIRLDDWVLCRLYNKKNNWEKEAQQFQQKQRQPKAEQTEDGSFADTMDSVGVASDSHRTGESDVDNEFDYVEFAGKNGNPGATAMRRNPTTGGVVQTSARIEEDSEWFTDLNLDDLQGTFSAFGGGGAADMALCQDYPFTNLLSPLPKSSSQLNFSGLLSPGNSVQLNLPNF